MTGNHCGHVHFFAAIKRTTRAPRTSVRFLSSGAISSRTSAAESNIPSSIYPLHDEQESRRSHGQNNERPEMMILRLATQCAFFFHGLGYSSSSEPRGKAGSCGSASPNKSGQAVAGGDGRYRSAVCLINSSSGSHCGCSVFRKKKSIQPWLPW
jgi:hypothetical protein